MNINVGFFVVIYVAFCVNLPSFFPCAGAFLMEPHFYADMYEMDGIFSDIQWNYDGRNHLFCQYKF
jgi:hypothetical protein